ncbi:hypothetical protein D9757_009236 [Collybiopsis confluens]|uniref:Afadin and alpha-actinin-binding-domain-containing protein n=1 Tax=Collybiopsis confluens TaxID=2823264 RepID=A0A8H5HAI1_9AGAR|nr:hypothetical protein D9757_009236 [Collybiopsis confluens]
MAATTPAHKSVHWGAADANVYSDFGSPSSLCSDDSTVSTSSLQYVNSQLVAHGFAPGPNGISLDGLGARDIDKAVKCFLGLLGQRIKDMSRTEQLTTELRTLRYDHERMVSMYKTASDSAANFEREVNTQKSRVSAITKALKSTESAHKHTSAELSRTRGALQAVRAAHQMELKKKEKELEKMVERWQKISDNQVKLGTVGSGMRFSGSAVNASVQDSVGMVAKGTNFLEVSLEQAEKAREQLGKEMLALRVLLLKAVNEVRNVIFELRRESPEQESPAPMILQELFVVFPPDFTTTTLYSNLGILRKLVDELSPSIPSTLSSSATIASSHTLEEEEAGGFCGNSLNTGLTVFLLDNSQERIASQDAEFKAPFDCVADGPQNPSTLAIHSEHEEYATLRKELEEDRRKCNEAMARLGEERLRVEAETRRYSEEEKPAELSTLLEESEEETEFKISLSKPRSKARSLKVSSSPRRPQSPSRKFQISVGAGKAARRPRLTNARLSMFSGVEPAFETEVIPPAILVGAAPSSPPPPLMGSGAIGGALLPNSFVLPPPSPFASIPPPKLDLLSSDTLSLAVPLFPSSSVDPLATAASPVLTSDNDPSPFAESPSLYPPPTSPSVVQQTPLQGAFSRPFPFPVAKPLVTHMVHAYSPVRPSPLSRILMLGNSPDSPSNNVDGMGRESEALVESDDSEEREEHCMGDMLETELFPVISASSSEEVVVVEETLAQQLGIPDSPPESHPVVFRKPGGSPTREKKARIGEKKRVPSSGAKTTATSTSTMVKVTKTKTRTVSVPSSSKPPPPRPPVTRPPSGTSTATTKLKPAATTGGTSVGKIKASTSSSSSVVPSKSAGGAGGVGEVEKENDTDASRIREVKGTSSNGLWKVVPPSVPVLGKGGGGGGGGGGPRRVPVDSAEAPPLGFGRGKRVSSKLEIEKL